MATTIKKSKPLPEAIAKVAPSAPPATKAPKAKKNGHAKALPVVLDLNQPGGIRVGHWLMLLSISHASFYSRLAAKELPPCDGRDGMGKRPFWKTSIAKTFLEA